jgi:hypothetical protein
VIEERITKRLAEGGIVEVRNLAREIEEENDAERLARAVTEMDDEERTRHERLRREEADLSKVLEESRERVGVAPDDLRHVVGAALSRVGFDLDQAEGYAVGKVKTYHFDPKAPAFAKDAGWDEVVGFIKGKSAIHLARVYGEPAQARVVPLVALTYWSFWTSQRRLVSIRAGLSGRC